MNFTKTLVPNKEWIIKTEDYKLGSISKSKKGYSLLKKGKVIKFKSLKEINDILGLSIEENKNQKISISSHNVNQIYDYPCSNKPFNPVYNIKLKLPLFSKSLKSKSQYCAGYYIIQFRKGWVKSFCPKLITLERYPYYGPYKTEIEMKDQLNKVNKNEET